jgi:hypothetical protein
LGVPDVFAEIEARDQEVAVVAPALADRRAGQPRRPAFARAVTSSEVM